MGCLSALACASRSCERAIRSSKSRPAAKCGRYGEPWHVQGDHRRVRVLGGRRTAVKTGKRNKRESRAEIGLRRRQQPKQPRRSTKKSKPSTTRQTQQGSTCRTFNSVRRIVNEAQITVGVNEFANVIGATRWARNAWRTRQGMRPKNDPIRLARSPLLGRIMPQAEPPAMRSSSRWRRRSISTKRARSVGNGIARRRAPPC